MRKRRILIVFPDEWLAYSPSVLNFYRCCSENFETEIIYFNNIKFRNEGLVEKGHAMSVGLFAAWFWRKTAGYKFYKVLRLFFLLIRFRLSGKKFEKVIAIDSSGYLPARLLFKNCVYFSLETEKDRYFRYSKLLGIDTLIIQSEERRNYLFGSEEKLNTFYIQNAPILDATPSLNANKTHRDLLYMGNIEFGYGLEQFIGAVVSLDANYTLTLKGIRNEKYFQFLSAAYESAIESGRLKFDFFYIDQEKIIEYVSKFYIGITGYDLELAKKSFNYFSSPAGKLFNYYAAGIPVIGIDITGLKSVKDFNAGVLIDNVNPGNIRAAIQKIESDYGSFCENACKAAVHFDFRKAYRSFEDEALRPPSQGRSSESKFNLKNFLTRGHERSIRTKRNILSSFMLKALSIIISFLFIPMTIHYLNPVKYGIWLTITSFVSWFAFFDLGLGNGLRNRLGEALANDNKELARIYVSTSYAVLSIVMAVVYTGFLIFRPWLDWSAIFNTSPEMNEEISRLMLVVFSFFCLQFIIKHISVILKSDQRSAASGGINTLASLLSLLIVFILTKVSDGSLFWLSAGVSFANILAPLIVSVISFSGRYRYLLPSLKHVKFRYAKDLMSLGFMFFIMQCASLILFSTDSIIIAQLYGPEEVTPYNIAFKYFSIVTMFFTILTSPLWNAYTDAYHKQDFEWIRRITKKLSLIWIVLLIGVLLMLVFAELFYKLWIGNDISVPFSLSLGMALWVLISAWTTIYGNFLSGVGKIRLSLYHSIVMIFLNIPLSVFLAKHMGLGSTGVILGTALCVLPQVFLHPMQYKRIVEHKASGIWAR